MRDDPVKLVAPTLVALGLLLAVGASAQEQPPAPAVALPTAPGVLEAKAMGLLKAAGDQLASAKTMSFTAVATYESPSRLGPPLAYTVESKVTLQRPDRLRVISRPTVRLRSSISTARR